MDAMHVWTAIRYGADALLTLDGAGKDKGLIQRDAAISMEFDGFHIWTPERAWTFLERLLQRQEYRRRHPVRDTPSGNMMSDGWVLYVPLIESFVAGEITAQTFQDQFLTWWREDRDAGVSLGEVIEDFMVGVDCYDEDPEVLHRIDADQLKAEASEALRHLRPDT